MSGKIITLRVSERPDDGWWCDCTECGDIGPHVHCVWGGRGFHTHLVSVDTGRCRPGCPHHEKQPGRPHTQAATHD